MKKVIKAILVTLCMAVIFCFSSDNGNKSTKKSDGVIVNTMSIIYKRNLSIKEKQFYKRKFVTFVRKSAHFIIYFILGCLMTSFICEFNFIDKIIIIISILTCFLYACSDEIHQLFVPGRSGMIRDVFLDTFASSIVSILYIRFRNKISKNKKISYNI